MRISPGSGFSLIRPSGEGEWEGKLADAKNNIKAKLGAEDALAEDVQYSLVLYFASQQAIEHVTEHTAAMGFDIDIHVVQTLDNDVRVSADAMVTLCRAYYDDRNDDEHKGSPVLGFQDCALPLVLEHNTPNNSIALLWADTSDREKPPHRRALFPRYERHHASRP